MSKPEEEVTEQKAAGESGREVLVREQSVVGVGYHDRCWQDEAEMGDGCWGRGTSY